MVVVLGIGWVYCVPLWTQVSETLLHVLCDAGDISLMISIDRQSGWVFHEFKSWFEVMNFLRRIFIRYSGDLYSFQCGMQLLMWIEGWSYCWWVW